MTTTTFQEAVEHRDAMVDVLTEITQDCVLLGLRPCTVGISRWSHGGPLDVHVQFLRTTTDAVDALADSYELEPGPGDVESNYTRRGQVDLNGRAVNVVIYTGRPDDTEVPAGYAPQAVQS